MKSAVQINGISSTFKIYFTLSNFAKKKVIRLSHLSSGSYLYLADENRVAEKLSAVSAGFLCTTNIGLLPTNKILISPYLIRGKNLISTSIPFSPTMYCSQNSINSPNFRCSTWLSKASVTFILVSNGNESPAL